MMRFVSATIASVLSSAAFAQAVDCSAFEHSKDGSWIVIRETRLVAVEDGVSKSVALAPAKRFDRANPAMDGVDGVTQLDAHCR